MVRMKKGKDRQEQVLKNNLRKLTLASQMSFKSKGESKRGSFKRSKVSANDS